jgi:hypothetical protein
MRQNGYHALFVEMRLETVRKSQMLTMLAWKSRIVASRENFSPVIQTDD